MSDVSLKMISFKGTYDVIKIIDNSFNILDKGAGYQIIPLVFFTFLTLNNLTHQVRPPNTKKAPAATTAATTPNMRALELPLKQIQV